MRIAICDDEKEITEEVKAYLCNIQKDLDSRMDIFLFHEAKDFIYEIEEMYPYDIVFLDIEIGLYNGIHIAEKLRKKYPTVVIIFITGHCQYVYDVFDVQPCGFIKKPLKKKDIEHVFYMALKQCESMPVFEYNYKSHFYRVYLKEIYYITSEKRKILIMKSESQGIFYGKMEEVEKKLNQLSNNFLRINQSVIINTRYLKEINYYTVALEIDSKKYMFNISQKYRVAVRKWCMEMWKLS